LEKFRGKVEVNDPAPGAKMPHCLLTVDDASAGGQDAPERGNGKQVTLFNPAETGVTFLLDDFPQLPAFPGLDENVGVEKIKAEALGQQNAHGAFPHPGHSNEHHSLFHDHAPIAGFIIG
jgi:hypothetical protein